MERAGTDSVCAIPFKIMIDVRSLWTITVLFPCSRTVLPDKRFGMLETAMYSLKRRYFANKVRFQLHVAG